MMRFSKQICPFCPTSPTKKIFSIQQNNTVLMCTRCNLQFTEIYPDIHEAGKKMYSDSYFNHMIERTVQRKKYFDELLFQIESILNRKGHLLEVGAGEGTLLHTALDRGWEVEGTEVSQSAVRYIHKRFNIKMSHGVLEDISLQPNSYDAIILHHVLEHVKNPKTTLEKVAELVRGDGIIRIEVPNIASLSCKLKNIQSYLRLKRNPWKHYATGHHFWFFTPKTLKNTIEKSGLALVKIETTSKRWRRIPAVQYLLNLWGGVIIAFACKKI